MTHQQRSAAAWPNERQVADELAIDCGVERARAVLDRVPFWFHTFSLDRPAGLYTPGEARDHGYRLDAIPDTFDGLSVLDVGTFDGFYAYLAERRGAARVVGVDNEQYRHWVRDRWDIELSGGEGFRAIGEVLDSKVEYRRMDAHEVADLGERFDFIFCFGILHRNRDPFGLLEALLGSLAPGGRMLVETANTPADQGATEGAVQVVEPGGMYAKDEYVFWQFSSGGLDRMVSFLGDWRFDMHSNPTIVGLPRIIGFVNAPTATEGRPAARGSNLRA